MSWVKRLFVRRRVYGDLSAEIREHLEEKIEELVVEGMPRKQAEAKARKEFGNVTLMEERGREVWQWPSLESFVADIRFAVRMLRKSPGFTAVAVLTLALGIGANTAIFSVINSVLLSNLPVKDPQQLVFLTNPDNQGMESGFGDGERDFLTYPEYQELARDNQVFSGLFAASSFTAEIPVELERDAADYNGPRSQVSLVSGSYFSVFGVNPILGGTFSTEVDKLRDANPIAVISYSFWQNRFGGARDVLGRKIRILKTPYEIIGVAPPQFHGETVGADPGVWVPLTMQSEIFPGKDFLSPETNHFHKVEWLQAIGRLKRGVSFVQAKASVEVAFQQLMESQAAGMSAPDKKKYMNQRLAVSEGSRGASTLRADFGKPLEILMVVVGLILLIACANVANLLLARSSARQKEIAVRVALGAGASRLFRQVLTESILLAAMGGAVGLLLADWADSALLHMVSGGASQAYLDIHLDARILAFTFGASLFTGILFGIAPAFRATRVELSHVLKSASRTVAGSAARSGRLPIGKVLVIAQVALSLLLLIVAGLFIRSFRNLSEVQLGFDRDHILQFYSDGLTYGYHRPEIIPLYQEIIQRIAAVPGVRAVSLSDNGLLGDTDSQDPFSVEGQEVKAGEAYEARWDIVGPNFFSTSGIPVLLGREIGPQDTGNGQLVGLINQTFAKMYFPNSNPIGQHVQVHESAGHFGFVIVGVAADSKHRSMRERPFPRFYVPYFNPIGDNWRTGASFIIRSSGDPSAVSSAIRDAVKQVAANLPPVRLQTMQERLTQSLASDSMITQLAGAFGALAIILVCIGLYGIMAYAVSGRINEIGIRIALGAQRGIILWLVLREALFLVLVGAAIGLPVVYGAGKWISSLLYGVTPADPLTLAMGTALMFVVGVFACYIPARRAMRVDPMIALRYE
ncbi:MAG TPA: ABC transporter permease [Candidatus Acidoferrales bacterium]|nr:ABC transporter permease [Candidatus Acidoferrales bacterium]